MTDKLENLLEIIGQLTGELHPFPCFCGCVEGKLSRMQALAGREPAVFYVHGQLQAAVDGVSEQRMPDMSQMDPDSDGSCRFPGRSKDT